MVAWHWGGNSPALLLIGYHGEQVEGGVHNKIYHVASRLEKSSMKGLRVRTFFEGDGSAAPDINIMSASVNSIGEKCGTEPSESGVSAPSSSLGEVSFNTGSILKLSVSSIIDGHSLVDGATSGDRDLSKVG